MRDRAYLIILLLLLNSCGRRGELRLLPGLWKVEKVEVMKGPELIKTIDTGCQYWSFTTRPDLRIFSNTVTQNTFHLTYHKKNIKGFDPVSGYLKDEFTVSKISYQKLTLLSRRTVDSQSYNIIYYFAKVNDSTGAYKDCGF